MRLGPLMSSRAISLTSRCILATIFRIPGRVLEAPVGTVLFPQVRRPEAVDGRVELLFGQRDVFEEVLEILPRELVVVTLDELHALFARDLAVADLLRSIVRRAADAELRERRVVVEHVDAVVDAAVLGVRAL